MSTKWLVRVDLGDELDETARISCRQGARHVFKWQNRCLDVEALIASPRFGQANAGNCGSVNVTAGIAVAS